MGGGGGWGSRICLRGPSNMITLVAMSDNLLERSSPEAVDITTCITWNLVCIIEDSGTTKIVQIMILVFS